MPDFLERVKRQKISLETASMIDDSRLRGVVRVLNVDFHKSVLIRFTVDEWRTQSDQLATYVPNSCDGLSDRFTFNLAGAQSMQPGQRLIFAICYRVAGQEIWDSNQGRNYVFQCISNSNYLPSIALSNPTVSDAFLPYM
jgi:protein phosphatase 1 regulatory subunit 3A/B/C/D/E